MLCVYCMYDKYNPVLYFLCRSNLENQPMQPVSHSTFTSPHRLSPVAARSTVHDSEVNFSTETGGPNLAIGTSSPPIPFHEDDILGLYNPPNTTARR